MVTIDRRYLLACGLASSVTTQARDVPLMEDRVIIRYQAMPSKHADTRNVSVLLPQGYESGNRRYRVIYMQDGQNIFAHSLAYGGQSWRIDSALATIQQDAIVVGIWNTPKRRPEYSPTGVETALSPALRARVAREHNGPSVADGYLRCIVEELKPFIDKTYRTRPASADTIIMGSSMGALISLYALCEYPGVFGRAGCLSTHWTMLSAPESYSKPDLETPAMIAGFETYLSAKLPQARDRRIWMDHGTRNLDSHYGPYQARMDALFEARGWIKGKNFESRVYEGADHNEASWRARLPEVLTFLLA